MSSSSLTFGSTLGVVQSMGFDKCIMVCSHQYSILHNSFTDLKIICALPIHSSSCYFLMLNILGLNSPLLILRWEKEGPHAQVLVVGCLPMSGTEVYYEALRPLSLYLDDLRKLHNGCVRRSEKSLGLGLGRSECLGQGE